MTCTDFGKGRLISRYELGLLSGEESSTFEAHLLECDCCYQDYFAMNPVIEVMKANRVVLTEVLAMGRPFLRSWFSQISGSGKRLRDIFKNRFGLRPAFALRFAVLAVIGFILMLLVVPAPRGYRALAVIEPAPFKPFEVRFRGSPEPGTGERLFSAGMQAYVARDYSKAAEKLRQAHASNAGNTEIRFYLGLSYLLDARPDSAMVHLREVADSRDVTLKEATLWYLANAFLATEHPKQAERRLREVVVLNGPYRERSWDLLEQIKAARQDRFILIRLMQDLKMELRERLTR